MISVQQINTNLIQNRLIKKELLQYAMSNDLNNLKKVYYENNNKLGSYGGWMLLAELFYYSCEIMSIELLDTLYYIYDNLDIVIKLDNNPSMFYKSIITQNILFYNYLISYKGPLCVLQKNLKNLGIFIIQKRIKFTLILQLLNDDDITELIQTLTQYVIIQYYENNNCENEISYENNDFIEYKDETYCYCNYECQCNTIVKKLIPICIEDKQYIDFIKNIKINQFSTCT